MSARLAKISLRMAVVPKRFTHFRPTGITTSRGASHLARQTSFFDTPDENSSWYQVDPNDNHVVFSRLANTTTLDIKVTQECNLNCPMCIDDKSSKGSIDFASVRSFLEQAKFFTKWQVRGLAIGGGEPLFKKREEVLELVKFARQNGYYTTVNTNGLLLTDELIAKYSPFLSMIHLPLDGSTRDVVNTIRTAPTVLRKTIRNIRAFNNNNYEGLIKVATVATKKNRHDLPNVPSIFEKEKLHFDIWRIYQFRAHGQGRFAVDDLAITEAEFNETLEAINATKSPYLSKIAPNYTGEYIRKLFLLPDNSMSIGNTKLDFNLTNFDEAGFIQKHGDHLAALERYIGSRIDHYTGVTGRRFRLPGIQRDKSDWTTYYEKRIAKKGGLLSYWQSKVKTHKPFLDRVAALAEESTKPILEAGSGSGALGIYLSKHQSPKNPFGLNVHAGDVDPRILTFVRDGAQTLSPSTSHNITLQRIDLRATQLPRGQYSIAFNHGVMEHFSDPEIHEIVHEMLRVADYFVMCVPTSATGADPKDFYGDERYLSVWQWDEILKRSGCKIVEKLGYDGNGIRDVDGAPFLTYVLTADKKY